MAWIQVPVIISKKSIGDGGAQTVDAMGEIPVLINTDNVTHIVPQIDIERRRLSGSTLIHVAGQADPILCAMPIDALRSAVSPGTLIASNSASGPAVSVN